MNKLLFVALVVVTAFSSAWSIPLRKPIHFSNACKKGKSITISAVGDILLHSMLQRKATTHQDFKVLWKKFIPHFLRSDISYANLEGAVATGVNMRGRVVRDPGFRYDNYVYSAYPQFNYNKRLIKNLVQSGIDVVSTANNHSLDRISLGVNRTIDALEAQKLKFTGTRKKYESDRTRPLYTIVRKNGISVAFIACTFSTNGIPDYFRQVLHCHKWRHRKRMFRAIRLLKSRVDAVIITPHWGREYKTYPSKQEVRLGRKYLEAGATAVLGNHPHVLQPMEKYTTRDGREGLIIYSLGNFVSNQHALKKRSTAIFFLGLTKGNGVTSLNGVKFIPAEMNNRFGSRNLELRPAYRNNRKQRDAFKHILKVLPKENMANFSKRVVTNSECY